MCVFAFRHDPKAGRLAIIRSKVANLHSTQKRSRSFQLESLSSRKVPLSSLTGAPLGPVSTTVCPTFCPMIGICTDCPFLLRRLRLPDRDTLPRDEASTKTQHNKEIFCQQTNFCRHLNGSLTLPLFPFFFVAIDVCFFPELLSLPGRHAPVNS